MLKFLTERRIQSLYEYIRSGRLEDLRRAVAKSPGDANSADRAGSSPLILAAESGQTAAIEILLQAGADINHQDAAGKTALLRAAENGKLEATRLLLGKGASTADRKSVV